MTKNYKVVGKVKEMTKEQWLQQRRFSVGGSEIAAAVQRYDYIDLERTMTEHGIHLELTNFYDEAWFILRLNEDQEIAEITGGEITPLGSTLYLVCANAEQVDIRFS